ncbi:MAG: response regulator transcription factor [Dehalococcoidales bacterium]|nr:response regulator transcription factor [Dehalococcoidales bacterium]
MGKSIRVLVVDDHQVVREGLRRLLEQEEGIELVGEGANNKEALLKIELLSPDVVLMDIKMPGGDGIELTRQVIEKHPAVKVMMLTLYDAYLNEAMKAGAKGYLLKDIKHEELTRAIKRIYLGEVVISESIALKAGPDNVGGAGDKAGGLPAGMFEEVQVVIPPPVEAEQLMKFSARLEEALNSRLLQVVGSWEEGTVMTIVLNEARSEADIMGRFGNISGVGASEEKPSAGKSAFSLIKQAASVPRLKNRARKTIFVTFEKPGQESQSRESVMN